MGVRKSTRPVKKFEWLSVCSEMQMICVWSGWWHCHPHRLLLH